MTEVVERIDSGEPSAAGYLLAARAGCGHALVLENPQRRVVGIASALTDIQRAKSACTDGVTGPDCTINCSIDVGTVRAEPVLVGTNPDNFGTVVGSADTTDTDIADCDSRGRATRRG